MKVSAEQREKEISGDESLPPFYLPSGGNSSYLWEWRGDIAFLLVACLSEPHIDEVRANVMTISSH